MCFIFYPCSPHRGKKTALLASSHPSSHLSDLKLTRQDSTCTINIFPYHTVLNTSSTTWIMIIFITVQLHNSLERYTSSSFGLLPTPEIRLLCLEFTNIMNIYFIFRESAVTGESHMQKYCQLA